MLLLPEFVLDHPEFTQFNFNYRQLVKIFVSGGEGLKTVLRAGIAPWQLAALSGMFQRYFPNLSKPNLRELMLMIMHWTMPRNGLDHYQILNLEMLHYLI